MAPNESKDKPRFGERIIENDPEALHDSMVAKGYEPWGLASVQPGHWNGDEQTHTATEAEVREIQALAGPKAQARVARAERRRENAQPLSPAARWVTAVVALAILAPFVIVLWKWAVAL